MKQGKKWLALCMSLMCLSMPIYAAGYSKTQSVQYGSTNLVYNSEDKTDSVQPIVIEGTTYLPIRAMSNLLGLNIGWSQATKTVSIDGVLSTSSSLQTELQAKNYEIMMLRRELETLRGQTVTDSSNSNSSNSSNSSSSSSYEQTSGTDILGTELTATRRALENEYADYFDDIDLNFAVSLSSNRLRVVVSVEGTEENREFRRLSNSKVKDFIEDICEEIRDRHDDIVISGEIENDDTNRTYYTFNYSRNDKLTYSSDSSSSSSSSSSSRTDSEIKSELERIVNSKGNVYIDGFGSVSVYQIRATDISNDTIYASIYLDLSSDDAKDAWNRNTGVNYNDDLRRDLRKFSDDLNEDYNIRYTIMTSYGERLGTYDYEEDRIDLNDIQTN